MASQKVHPKSYGKSSSSLRSTSFARESQQHLDCAGREFEEKEKKEEILLKLRQNGIRKSKNAEYKEKIERRQEKLEYENLLKISLVEKAMELESKRAAIARQREHERKIISMRPFKSAHIPEELRIKGPYMGPGVVEAYCPNKSVKVKKRPQSARATHNPNFAKSIKDTNSKPTTSHSVFRYHGSDPQPRDHSRLHATLRPAKLENRTLHSNAGRTVAPHPSQSVQSWQFKQRELRPTLSPATSEYNMEHVLKSQEAWNQVQEMLQSQESIKSLLREYYK